ncbi:MAG: DUF2239 family protein [Acidobacteria bacterium]|nr:DUF2239 family protein [Acidobacteriota bacterium]
MKPDARTATAFHGSRLLAAGPLPDVASATKAALASGRSGPVLVFDDETGAQIDLDLRAGSEPAPPRGPGRPRLGVQAREVTLLPRHWEWLGAQAGGASAALRRLIEAARRNPDPREKRRQAQERAHRVLTALAGNLPDYEEALRALYAGDGAAFEARLRRWPAAVRTYARRLASPAFDAESKP